MKTTTFPKVKLVYTLHKQYKNATKITCCGDAKNVLLDSWDMETIAHHEETKVILLNRANKVLGVAYLTVGSATGTLFDISTILQYALLANACSIIVSHNHPSGNATPSQADIDVTNKLKEACKYLDKTLLDHIIVTPFGDHFSFVDEGLL